MITKLNKLAFINAYMACAIWSSNTNGMYADEGQPDYDIDDGSELAPITRREMIRECLAFMQANNVDIEACADIGVYSSSYNAFSAAGHDYWLTRCGHGAGFWDRGLGDIGTRLSDAARADGNVDLYVGDDGMVYQ